MPRWWNETWGGGTWRHNMLVLLTGAGMAAGFYAVLWLTASKPEVECPPEWQCNGRPETNNPRCCLTRVDSVNLASTGRTTDV